MQAAAFSPLLWRPFPRFRGNAPHTISVILPFFFLCRPFSSYFSTRETNPTLLGVSLPLESLEEVQRGLKMPRMPCFLPQEDFRVSYMWVDVFH